MSRTIGAAGRLAGAFLDSRLTPLIVAATLIIGLLAVFLTPAEEEPQILVPMVDIMMAMPGASPEEIEQRLTTPLEKHLWGVPGVEYLYSTSMPGSALITVRFMVNEPLEISLVKVYDQLAAHADELPPGAGPPLVQLRTIDDVPFLTLTLYSATLDGYDLRRLALEVAREIEAVPDSAKVEVIGGQRRLLRVLPDPASLAAHGVSILDLAPAIQGASLQLRAGALVSRNEETLVEAGPLPAGAGDLRRLVVGVNDGRPVYLEDVAEVLDGPEEPSSYVFFGLGPALDERTGSPVAQGHPAGDEFPAVTISIAKRPGSNATDLAHRIISLSHSLEGRLIPEDVGVSVTRDYGETAAHKSNELIEHLLIATFSVILLIALTMGWRASIVVGIAVPVTLALTLFIYFLFGYTLNRVTLFALIFSIGILVDDAIVVVENIHRHYAMRDGRSLLRLAVDAVDEVGNPTILATFTVIAAILPMAFVHGLMGPYMRPIPVGASLAMIFSLLIAFVISPWAAVKLLRPHGPETEEKERPAGRLDRAYRVFMGHLVRSSLHQLAFFAGILLLLAAAMSLVWFGAVKVKMLPFDNKSEFQVILDLDEGAPREASVEAARAVGAYLATVPEVTDYQIYSGAAAPVNFNGLVRHYFLRRDSHQADIQVNLAGKSDREEQSHDIAKRVRPAIAAIAGAHGARAKVIEIPPGPPVLSTLVAEVYGPDHARQVELARRIETLFEQAGSVVDIDTTITHPQAKDFISIDREKSSLHGVPPARIVEAVRAALGAEDVALLRLPREREPVPIRIGFPAGRKTDLAGVLELRLPAVTGAMIRLGDLVDVESRREAQPIHHKNLKRVVYVLGDLAGEEESPVYAIAGLDREIASLEIPEGYTIERYSTHLPEMTERLSMKWDGEWHITYEVFRDLGVSFALVLVLIYILVVGWFDSFRTPWSIMLPIPLSLIGIIPGHFLFGAFFTATSMIGFIAGAGIIVRNSIILVDFIEQRVDEGMPLEQAVVDAGAVRFRPMLLTASSVIVGSFVILFDPIFQGLALSLMMGEVAATLLSRFAVPVLYYMTSKGRSVTAAS